MRLRWLLVPVLLLGCAAGGFAWFQMTYAHRHCTASAFIVLSIYAGDHGGRFPEHPQGFGDAMKLAMQSDDDAWLFSAPGDDGRNLLVAGDVNENLCTRAYVPGLTERSNGRLALLFDRYPTPGGDHFRSPWGTPLRDVVFVQGPGTIPEAKWPAFVQEQIGLLVEAGISKDTAEEIYKDRQPQPFSK